MIKTVCTTDRPGQAPDFAVNQPPAQVSVAELMPTCTGDPRGYSFTLTGPNGYEETVETDSTGIATFGDLVPGRYTLTENATPGGSVSFDVVARQVDGRRRDQLRLPDPAADH